MLCLTVALFIGELVVGFVFGWLDLVTISFFTLSNTTYLLVALGSIWLGCQTKEYKYNGVVSNTFGWVRAEVLGAFTNAGLGLIKCINS